MARIGVLAALAGPGLVLALPWRPTDDNEIVATVPARSEAWRAVQALRGAAQPDLPRALAAARLSLDSARREGDPRALGQAEAALAPWWREAAPPAPVRLLRAVVRQAQHAFGPALADLDALLRDATAVPLELQAQARLTRASILQVQARLAEAERDCHALGEPAFAPLGAAVAVPAAACRADLAGLQGRAGEAAAALARLAQQAPPAYAGWITLLRAELAERRGDVQAGALFHDAAAADPGVYAQAALADWLLAEGRPDEVRHRLAGRAEADALLLRLALAQHALGDPAAAASAATLRQRFDAARLRGEGTLHAREEARFALVIEGDPARALALARANWAVQKEPADARVFVAAARAAGQPQAAAAVHEHLRRHRSHDARLGGRPS